MSEPLAGHPGRHELRFRTTRVASFAPFAAKAQRLRRLALRFSYRRNEDTSSTKKRIGAIGL
jgi:hypothetical protein